MSSLRRAAPPIVPALGALALVLSAAATAPARAQVPWHFGGVSFPAAIDTFVSQATYRWTDAPALGVSLTYVIPGSEQCELTVYIYPVRAEDSLALRGDASAERDSALNEVRSYAIQYRQLDEFRVDTTDAVTVSLPGGGAQRGAYAQLFFRLGARRLRSMLYVFVSGDHYVKFRMSFDMDVALVLAPHLTSFMGGALASIRSEQP